MFYKGNSVLLVYTDDCLVFDPTQEGIDKRIKELQQQFDVENEGLINDYLGVQVIHRNGQIELSQPQLIDSILRDLGLIDKEGNPRKGVHMKPLPLLTTKLIGPDKKGKDFKYEWYY